MVTRAPPAGMWRRSDGSGRERFGWAWNGIEYHDRSLTTRLKSGGSTRPSSRTSRATRTPSEDGTSGAALEARLWAAFCAADTDSSGAISKRELYNALDAAGIRMTHTEKINAYKYGDVDDSGSMEWEEFRQVALKFKKLTRLPAVVSAASR